METTARFLMENLHKATINGESIWPVSAESEKSLRAELELTVVRLYAAYDRLESLIQTAAHSATKI
jgi:hypothetical protein